MVKSGRFSDEESDFINKNKDKLTTEEIAARLNRRVAAVSDYIIRHFGIAKADALKLESKAHLKSRPFYGDLQRQFDKDELKTFEDQYIKMYAQFKDDVFHTEEMQILDIIKISIMCDRILINQGNIRRQIEQAEYEILTEKTKSREMWDFQFLSNLERQVAVLQGSTKNMSDEYRDLMTRKSALLKDIKGTRDQRFKNIENSKQTFSDLMTSLTENSEYRRMVGLDMEKYRLAMLAETNRLGRPVEFEDGTIDRPLLNSETVLGDE